MKGAPSCLLGKLRMDTTFFDNAYNKWCEDIVGIIQDYLRRNGYNVDNNIIAHWKYLLTNDKMKYDILMWLKASVYSNSNPNNAPTEKTIKSVYGIEDSNILKNFRLGKRDSSKYYIEKLFRFPMPIFFWNVYSTKTKKGLNPFSREDISISLDNFWSLKNDLSDRADMFINAIPDPEIRDCQKIVKEYYLRNTYGFDVKGILASKMCQQERRDYVYQPDFITKIKIKVLTEIFQEKKLSVKLPEKYADINPECFERFIKYFSATELDLLKRAVPKIKYNKTMSYSKESPEPGYLLFILIYARRVCSVLKCEIKHSLNIVPYLLDELAKALLISDDLLDKTIFLIDSLLNDFNYSMPGDRDLTNDENLLLKNIKQVKYNIEETNSSSKDAYGFGCKVHGKYTNFETEESVDFQDNNPSATECPVLTMVSEKNYLDNFKKHCDKAKQTKRKNTTAARKVQYKLSGTEVRTFKTKIVQLINNCFNIPTIAERNEVELSKNYVLEKMDINDTYIESTFTEWFSLIKNTVLYTKDNNLLGLNCKLLPKILDWSLEWGHHVITFYNGVILHCLTELYTSLVGNNPDEFNKYITRIYNTEVLEYIKTSFPNFEELDTSKLSPDIQNRIARL